MSTKVKMTSILKKENIKEKMYREVTVKGKSISMHLKVNIITQYKKINSKKHSHGKFHFSIRIILQSFYLVAL